MARSSRGRGSAAPVIKNPARYKTEQCGTFLRTGGCPYGHKCQFAHGVEELRLRQDQPSSYKTKACRSFASTGHCPYGQRCRFVHGDAVEAQQLAALGLSDGKLLPPAGGLRAVQEGALKKTFTPLSLSPSSGPVSGCMSPLSSPWQSPVLPSSPIFIERDPVEGLPLFSDLPQVLPRKPPVPPASTLQASLLSASQTRPPSVFHSGRNSPTLMTRPAERLPSFDQLPEPGSLGRVPSALNYPLSPSLTHFGTGSLPYSNNQSQFLPDPVVPSNALSVAGRQTELPLPPNTLSTPYGSAPAALPGRTSFSLLHCAGLVSSSLASHSCSSVCAHNETQSHMGIDMRQAIADQLMKVLDDEVLPGQHANRDNSLNPFLSKSTSNAKMASPRSYDGPDPFWDSSDAFNKMDEQLSKVFLCDDETPVLSSIHGPVVPSRVPIAGLYPQHRYATISAPASIFGGA